jgi:hypothetical protein
MRTFIALSSRAGGDRSRTGTNSIVDHVEGARAAWEPIEPFDLALDAGDPWEQNSSRLRVLLRERLGH